MTFKRVLLFLVIVVTSGLFESHHRVRIVNVFLFVLFLVSANCSNTRSTVDSNSSCVDSSLNDSQLRSSQVYKSTCTRSHLDNADVRDSTINDSRLSRSNSSNVCRVSSCSMTRGVPSPECHIEGCRVEPN